MALLICMVAMTVLLGISLVQRGLIGIDAQGRLRLGRELSLHAVPIRNGVPTQRRRTARRPTRAALRRRVSRSNW